MWEYSFGAFCDDETGAKRGREKLATTTGGEPVHDASGSKLGSVHRVELSIAPGKMQICPRGRVPLDKEKGVVKDEDILSGAEHRFFGHQREAWGTDTPGYHR